MCCHRSVPFNHDTLVGVRLAQDLVNLMPDTGWNVEALAPVLADAFVRGAVVGAEAAAELTVLSSQLREVFQATDAGERAAMMNELLAVSVETIRIEAHDGLPLHLHFASSTGDLVRRVAAMTAGGIAVFIVEAGGGRLAGCARTDCSRVFADTSKNARRAYCSARCGNLDAVHRYRHRQRLGS